MLSSHWLATAAESMTLRIATIQSPKYQIVREMERSFNKITELTEGRIKFQVHYGSESGFKANQYISMLEKGMMDGALIPAATVSGQYPWLGAFGIPFICPDPRIREEMIDVAKPMLNDFCHDHGIIPLAYSILPDQWLVIYSRRNITSLADFKGMLIRCYDPNTIALTKALGAVPTSLQKSEVYMALQKGTIDGAITGDMAAKDMHMDEVCKYVFQLNTLFMAQIVGISKKAWDKVSAADQKIIGDIMKEYDARYWLIMNDVKRQEATYDYAKSHGMTVIVPPKDVMPVLSAAKDSLVQDFVAGKDVKQRQIIDLLSNVLKKYGY
jgi:C4-dicarboxylate-binding protein DctP